MTRTRKLLIAVAGAGLTFAVLGLAMNAIVWLGGHGRTVDRGAAAPHAQVALVLGALVEPSGRPSGFLRDRINVGARLYREGKVDKVLASGDHGRPGYDEVNAMKRGLMAAGVPERDIFTDHAGFDTWSSMVRARKVFGVESAIVVTQSFHLPRALYLGAHAGLDVHGLSADHGNLGRQGKRSWIREWVARPKALTETLTGRSPQFLGPQIPISGDGRTSAG